MEELFSSLFRYTNLLYMAVFVVCGFISVLKYNISAETYQRCSFLQRICILLFAVQSVVLITIHEASGDRLMQWLPMFLLAGVSLVGLMLTMQQAHRGSSRVLTNCIVFLLCIGITMLWRLRPDNCIRQIWWVLISVVVMNVLMVILRGEWVYRVPWWVFAGAALVLAALPFAFPSPENGSLNWVNIHGITFQPSELIKPLTVFMLSWLYIRKKRASSIMYGAAVVGVISAALLVQNDLGMILILCTVYLLLTYDYTQKGWILGGGAIVLAVAAVMAYLMVGHVRLRVDIWLDPWTDVDDSGYQIAQSLFAISGGRFFGTGLYRGMPYMIPEGWTDMIFAGIAEEFGSLFAAMMILIYLIMALLIFDLVARYESRLHRNMAMACAVMTGVQTILIIGGVIKFLPLTGVTLPLVSYGGTSLLATFMIMGIVQELFRSRSRTERRIRRYEEEVQAALAAGKPAPKAVPKVYTSRYKKSEKVLKICFVAFYTVLCLWMMKIIAADSVRIQANAYNPRLPQIESRFVRGTLYDSEGRAVAYNVLDPQQGSVRKYVYGPVTAPVTGYSVSGKSGLEKSLNDVLLQPASFNDTIKYWFTDRVVRGTDVVLTIDAEASRSAWEALEDFKGAVIVTEADTGRVRVLVSKPFYDPATVLDDWEELLADEDLPFYNRATQGAYPPGSTFKLITSLAWQRSKEYDPDYTYTCEGIEYFNDYGLPCFGGAVHGTLTVREAAAESCNTFFSTLGVKIGASDLIAAMKSLQMADTHRESDGTVFGAEGSHHGYNETGFPVYMSPSVYGLEKDSPVEELAATGIGQGQTLLTPLFLNRLTCAIANEGKVYDFSFLDKVLARDGSVVRQYLPQNPEQLISGKEAEYLSDLMAAVADHGTAAWSLRELSEEMPAYGKTGTAENASGVSHSWFTGYVEPPDGPALAVTVFVEQSGGRLYAADLAAEVLKALLYPEEAE